MLVVPVLELTDEGEIGVAVMVVMTVGVEMAGGSMGSCFSFEFGGDVGWDRE